MRRMWPCKVNYSMNSRVPELRQSTRHSPRPDTPKSRLRRLVLPMPRPWPPYNVPVLMNDFVMRKDYSLWSTMRARATCYVNSMNAHTFRQPRKSSDVTPHTPPSLNCTIWRVRQWCVFVRYCKRYNRMTFTHTTSTIAVLVQTQILIIIIMMMIMTGLPSMPTKEWYKATWCTMKWMKMIMIGMTMMRKNNATVKRIKENTTYNSCSHISMHVILITMLIRIRANSKISLTN